MDATREDLFGDGSFSIPEDGDDSLPGFGADAAHPLRLHPASAQASWPFAAPAAPKPALLCAAPLCTPPGDFDDPLQAVRLRRQFNVTQPDTWDPMASADCKEVLLFSSDPLRPALPATQEVAAVISEAFKGCLGVKACLEASVPELLEAIAENANYQVVQVSRIQNIVRFSMHEQFKRSYGVDRDSRVYHGTTAASASIIAKMGFRVSTSQRAKYGHGIYAASNVWEALAYAEPCAHSHLQTFLIADLARGPTRVGYHNMMDFGSDAEGRMVLTATNEEKTIFCAAYEDQLYAHYIVTMRYMREREHTPAHYAQVCIYNPCIYALFKVQAPAVPPAPTSAKSLAPKPRKVQELSSHSCFRVGDNVKVTSTYKALHFCRGLHGRIAKIVKDGHTHFCIEFADDALKKNIKFATETTLLYKVWHTDLEWMRCTVAQIEALPAPAPAPAPASAALAQVASDAALLLSLKKRKRA